MAANPGRKPFAYTPKRVTDLPSEREHLSRPTVYHLLGRLSASPNYVISDEDMLDTQRMRRVYDTPGFHGEYLGLSYGFGGKRKAKDDELNFD